MRLRALGQEAEQAVTSRLTREQALSLMSALPLGWISVEHLAAIYAVAAPVLYPHEARPLRALGRESGRLAFATFQRALLRLTTAQYIIKQAVKLWHTYHTAGDIEITLVTPRHIIVTVTNHPTLAHGVPSQDVFLRVLAAVNPEQFRSAFLVWVREVLHALGVDDQIAVDGQTNRDSRDGLPGLDRQAHYGPRRRLPDGTQR